MKALFAVYNHDFSPHWGTSAYVRPGGNRKTVEVALSKSGIYAPRGLDKLTWHKHKGMFTHAIITDAAGWPIVYLLRIVHQ